VKEEISNEELVRTLGNLQVECVAGNHIGDYMVYRYLDSKEFILIGYAAFIKGDDVSPGTLLLARPIFGRGSSIEEISTDLRELCGAHPWNGCRIHYLRPNCLFEKHLFTEWKRTGFEHFDPHRYRDPHFSLERVQSSYQSFLEKN
jgi:hypothetical protein